MAHSHPILPISPGGVRIERVVTSGVFELDGGSWEVDNNVWVIGDDNECFVIDAARTRDDPVGRRRPARPGNPLHAWPQRPHQRRAGTGVAHRCRGIPPPGGPGAVGPDTRGRARRGSWQTVRPLPWAMSSCGCSTRRVTHRVRAVSTCRLLMCALLRRHPLQRRSGGHGRSFSDFRRSSTRSAMTSLTLHDHTIVLTGHGRRHLHRRGRSRTCNVPGVARPRSLTLRHAADPLLAPHGGDRRRPRSPDEIPRPAVTSR